MSDLGKSDSRDFNFPGLQLSKVEVKDIEQRIVQLPGLQLSQVEVKDVGQCFVRLSQKALVPAQSRQSATKSAATGLFIT